MTSNKTKKVTRLKVAQHELYRFLREKGKRYTVMPTNETLAIESEKLLGIAPPSKGEPRSSFKVRVIDAHRVLTGRTARKSPPKRLSGMSAKIAAFYKSYEWKRARYDALKANDGKCELCGNSKIGGAVLHVDHIKNLRDHWELRLEPTNHQVLCHECNWGKSNVDDTDWREPRLVTLMGERVAD